MERIHGVHSVEGEASKTFYVVREKTARPDHVWPEVWTKIGKAAQIREKQEWAKEKPKLDNARKLREFTLSIRKTKKHREILKNSRRKLERPMAPAMPCKRSPDAIKIYIKKNCEELQRSSDRSQPAETKEDAESRNDFWSIEGDFICRHHVEPGVDFFVSKEDSFPIPLKHIDVTTTSHTSLDVLHES